MIATLNNISTIANAEIYQADFSPKDDNTIAVTGDGVLRLFKIADGTFKPIQFSMQKKEPQR